MIDLRFIQRGEQRVLQWRKIPLQIGWNESDEKAVIQPAEPVNFVADKNWTEWEDVPLVVIE